MEEIIFEFWDAAGEYRGEMVEEERDEIKSWFDDFTSLGLEHYQHEVIHSIEFDWVDCDSQYFFSFSFDGVDIGVRLRVFSVNEMEELIDFNEEFAEDFEGPTVECLELLFVVEELCEEGLDFGLAELGDYVLEHLVELVDAAEGGCLP